MTCASEHFKWSDDCVTYVRGRRIKHVLFVHTCPWFWTANGTLQWLNTKIKQDFLNTNTLPCLILYSVNISFLWQKMLTFHTPLRVFIPMGKWWSLNSIHTTIPLLFIIAGCQMSLSVLSRYVNWSVHLKIKVSN